VTVDGEGVACGPDGVTDFDLLRAMVTRKGSRRAFLCAFDLLELEGTDLRAKPWEERRNALTRLLRKAGDGIKLSEHLASTDGDTIFQHACDLGLEGIVAKRRDTPYQSGRSADWVEVVNSRAPAVTRLIESEH
jgi:bifunctional non-homologous end joining protein LigD